MRSILCLILLLCGCSKPNVRCDAHLSPINVSPVGAYATPAGAASKAAAATTSAESASARRSP